MNIKEINIKNFRNYSFLSLKPNKNINVFFGRNASGKTNILEAISMLISGKSFKTNRDKEVLQFGKESYEISALIELLGLEKDYYLSFEKNRKKIKVNLSNINTLKELRREGPLVTFIPEDLEIVSGGPNLRRKFIDQAISNLDLIYRYNLDRYNKILKEKNQLLKFRNKKLNERLLFEAYNIQLASLGSYIILSRKKFLEDLNVEIKDIHFNISSGDEDIVLNYDNPLVELDNIKDIEKGLLEGLRQALDKDLFVKYSTYGPQRDDILINVNSRDLKTYGSQGQKRSAVLSMKIVELSLIKKKRSISPIFLLDDVFSELDPMRRKGLLENIQGIQSFITMAERKYLEEFSMEDLNVYLVDKGEVKKIDGGKNAR